MFLSPKKLFETLCVDGQFRIYARFKKLVVSDFRGVAPKRVRFSKNVKKKKPRFLPQTIMTGSCARGSFSRIPNGKRKNGIFGRPASRTHLSLDDQVALVVDVPLGVRAHQLAVQLGALRAHAAGGRGRDPAALGQVEVRRREHLGPGRAGVQQQQQRRQQQQRGRQRQRPWQRAGGGGDRAVHRERPNCTRRGGDAAPTVIFVVIITTTRAHPSCPITGNTCHGVTAAAAAADGQWSLNSNGGPVLLLPFPLHTELTNYFLSRFKHGDRLWANTQLVKNVFWLNTICIPLDIHLLKNG